MTTLSTYPVQLVDGAIRALDGSTLPKNARALLVILPETAESLSDAEWRKPFDKFFVAVTNGPSTPLEVVSDAELNKLVHLARKA